MWFKSNIFWHNDICAPLLNQNILNENYLISLNIIWRLIFLKKCFPKSVHLFNTCNALYTSHLYI